MAVRAVFLWHLHQPEYRDPQTGQPILPWVRQHASRAYTDMAAMLERHPHVHAVVNWAPSLLLQLQAYVQGAQDLDEQLARKPAEELTPPERAHVLREGFSADWNVWVRPVRRYSELLDKRGTDPRQIDLLAKQKEFGAQELRDVQVHFVLAWMGFAARREEPRVAELVVKERNYTEEEKLFVLDAQRRVAARIVPRWRALLERGQVEITCSPLYHPILPLVIDTDVARRAIPAAALPPRFSYPQDAWEQVTRGLETARTAFGRTPEGMWPSEGSVSPEVIDLLAACGVRWCATDQGVLERSVVELGSELPDGYPAWYHPYVAGAERAVTVLFRDRELSDCIGFRYAKSDPRESAEDLASRIADTEPDALVTLALDGENPWEHYPQSGEAFLDAFYQRLKAGDVRTVLPRNELRERPARARIERIHSGSWIDANYRIWIGHPEDNAAWTVLGEARAAVGEAEEKGSLPREQLDAARGHLLVAEGSDWYWWYGDDFTTENAPEFDGLFRARIAECWRSLGLAPPERLSRPIIAPHKDAAHASAVVTQPTRLIDPVIDGYTKGYYEWAGAGSYRPGSTSGGSMFRGQGAFTQVFFGFSRTSFFLRLDPAKGADLTGEVRLLFSAVGGGPEKTVRMPLSPGGAESDAVDESGARVGSGRTGTLVELCLSRDALGMKPGARAALLIRVVRDQVELDRLPRYGEIVLTVPDRNFELSNWRV
ncbi:MAG TPA: glycoside hydrolase family 57 protein [Myxococcales bacterium]|nr:glycoside hydrolase family 57 protein [Myxococcales bacterium]